MAATGLSADPKEYRTRLGDQEDTQIDAWASELMRDVAKRRGVLRVLADFGQATGLGDADIERAFASGGGAPATAGRDAAGHLLVPAISLHHLVPGIRAVDPKGRQRLIDYLVENFDELVYV